MISLVGVAVKAIMKHILVDNKSYVPIWRQFMSDTIPDANDRLLRIVCMYKHMGTKSTVSMRDSSEIDHRSVQMYDSFRPARSRVYANDHLTAHTRIQLSDSLLETRLLYNAFLWTRLSPAANRMLSNGCFAPWRAIFHLESRAGTSHHIYKFKLQHKNHRSRIDFVLHVCPTCLGFFREPQQI